MKTLSLEGFRVPFAKILATTFLASSLIVMPMVWADESMPNVAVKIMERFKLSQQQIDNLMLANRYATVSNHPEAIQALMLKESTANANARSVRNCHGILQIMTSTAIGVLAADAVLRGKYFGESKLTSAKVTKQLKTDPVFSVEIADRLIARELESGHTLEQAIFAYNRGSAKNTSKKSATKYPYVKDVFTKINQIVIPLRDMMAETEIASTT